MQKRTKVAIAAGAALLTIFLLIAALSAREPRYQGLTMGQWLRSVHDPRAGEAMLILGTNNLSLLVNRVGYDREKDHLCRLLDKLPSKLRSTPWLASLGSRREDLSWEATQVLAFVGTNAAPAIPGFAAIVNRGDISANNALKALSCLGDDGLAVVASTARSTNALLRQMAVGLLLAHPESALARQAITKATTDPNPIIRMMAQTYATNLSWSAPPPRPLRDHFQ